MRYRNDTRGSYSSDLLLAASSRVALLALGLAILVSLGACKNGGDLDLTLKGSAAGKPPVVEGGKTN